MLVRTLVVDDERPARDELCFQLGRLTGVDLVGQASDGPEALETIDALQPDLVFLDVQMPGLGGFEVARRLLERPQAPQVVFVTAFDRYAIEAFDVNAVDYLLKPVERRSGPGRRSPRRVRRHRHGGRDRRRFDMRRLGRLGRRRRTRAHNLRYSLSRLVCARLTGISVAFASFIFRM